MDSDYSDFNEQSEQGDSKASNKPIFNEPMDLPKPAVKAKKGSVALRIFFGILFGLSVIVNILLLIGFAALATVAFQASDDLFTQEVISKGAKQNRIAVISIEGVIDMEMSKSVVSQIKMAKEDDSVKALIIRTLSPGGSVVASDEIHHAISVYRKQTGRPVVAFMQGLAASGGYYTSVACDKIVAEPTTITGSIGVIMQTFAVKGLLEEKLGVEPVTVKSGPRKDWPSVLGEVTDEQKMYLMEKLIGPAYDRFVQLIDQGRDELTLEEVIELADGSIYHANEALEKNLIDYIGYKEDAITITAGLANIVDPQVFEYKQQFRFSDILGVEEDTSSLFSISKNNIRSALTPELLYLWDGMN